MRFHKDNFCPRASFHILHICFLCEKKKRKKLYIMIYNTYKVCYFHFIAKLLFFCKLIFGHLWYTKKKHTHRQTHTVIYFFYCVGFMYMWIEMNLDYSVNDMIGLNLWHISFVQCYSITIYRVISINQLLFKFVILSFHKTWRSNLISGDNAHRENACLCIKIVWFNILICISHSNVV